MKCNSTMLWTLVNQHADPADDQNNKLFAHVESCEDCQQYLNDLSGGPTWVKQASSWLEPMEALTHNSTGLKEQELEKQELNELANHIDLSFLSTPRHPEMLGRIGRYDVESILGRGGMGVVFRGFDVELQRAVAIKVLAPEWASSTAAKQRFAREAQAAASVAHENVVAIYNVSEDAHPPYLVMPYVPGMTLDQLVAAKGPLDAHLLIRIASQLASGLSAAHSRGLIHRDVKPANILVGENTDRVWLTDFGLARAADEAKFTRTGVIAGTPQYMSPEQARGKRVDVRSDWFSLGCTLYFACTATPPFSAPTTFGSLQKTISSNPKSLLKLRSDLPPTLVRLIHQLLAKNPARRPASFHEIDKRLRQAEAETHHSGRAWLRSKSKMLLAVGCFGLATMLGSLLFWPDANIFQQRPETSKSGKNNPPSAASSNDDSNEQLNSQAESEQLLRWQIEDGIDSIAGWSDGFDQELLELGEQINQLGSD